MGERILRPKMVILLVRRFLVNEWNKGTKQYGTKKETISLLSFDKLVTPHGPFRPIISNKTMPKEYTSPFCVPLAGGLVSLSNSGDFHRPRLNSISSLHTIQDKEEIIQRFFIQNSITCSAPPDRT